MSYSVFYSWQSDSPPNCNRNLIRSALNDAIASLDQAGIVEDAPRVESGVEGVSGSPEVASVLFSRIKRSAIFVGDMTIVGEIPASKPENVKRVPNPNVLLEMGYASGTIGWDRVICVMNTEKHRPEELPFDVRNRRFPITYELSDKATENKRQKVRSKLSGEVLFAIRCALDAELQIVYDAIASLDINSLNVMRQYCAGDWFAFDTSGSSFGGILDTPKLIPAIARLLDLRLIELRIGDPTIRDGEWAYTWTYLGRNVLHKLKLRGPEDMRHKR